ncbi:MAG: flagellar brake protein [Gammaproteobacteria bacterium]|nr:flagellar brake protein [Gammaproteobacteria bacterium]
MANGSIPEGGAGNAKAGIEDLQKYLLQKNREIVQLLKALASKPDLITARIPSSSQSVITAVLDVLPAKNLVVLDYGPNESLNKKLLEADRVVFTTRHDMVETRFSCDGLRRVKYNNGPAFAAAIPQSIMYHQRRGYFRIKPLISHPVLCSLTLAEGVERKLKVIDIGVKGLALQDDAAQLEVEAGDLIGESTLALPANPSLKVDLEIRYTTPFVSKEGHSTHRVGAKFVGLKQREEFTLQRFINMVQMEQNALARG